VFGETSLFLDTPHEADAFALGYVELFLLSRESFDEMMDLHPEAHARMRKAMETRTGRFDGVLVLSGKGKNASFSSARDLRREIVDHKWARIAKKLLYNWNIHHTKASIDVSSQGFDRLTAFALGRTASDGTKPLGIRKTYGDMGEDGHLLPESFLFHHDGYNNSSDEDVMPQHHAQAMRYDIDAPHFNSVHDEKEDYSGARNRMDVGSPAKVNGGFGGSRKLMVASGARES